MLVSGTTATVEIRFEGRLACGTPLAFDAVDVFDVRDGLISRLSSWYDSHAVRAALLDALAAAAPPAAAELGSLRHITPERRRAALRLVRHGRAFRVELPLDGIAPPLYGRPPLRHRVLPPDGHPEAEDDLLERLNTQASSHWDALRHVAAPGGRRYGGRAGADLGIDLWRDGVVTRAVLLDLGADLGVGWNEARPIGVNDLEAAAERRGVEIRPGDALLLRTGFLAGLLATPPAERPADPPAPGLANDDSVAAWLAAREVAAVAADNPGLEVLPADPARPLLHARLLPDLGLAVGELWWLDDLAADCARDGVWEGLLVAVPLYLRGGCASPANAIVLK